jgi:hypothetical protein
MSTVFITYQPAGRASSRLAPTIKSLGETYWLTPTLCLLKSSHNPNEVYNRLKISLLSNDTLLVVEITPRYATNLPEGGKAWLYANLL